MSRAVWQQAAEDYSEQHIQTCSCRGIGFVRINAPLGHVLFGKAVPCVCKRDGRMRERAQAMRRESGISDIEMATWTFESFRPGLCQPNNTIDAMKTIKSQCERYAKQPEGWLVLSGPIGCGKTHLAYAIAAESLRADRPVYAHSVPGMLGILRSGYESGGHDVMIARLQDVDLLVLDDLGAQRGTDWERETLYILVNHRYSKRLPMVVTMNHPRSDLDERIASRLAEGSESVRGWTTWLKIPCGDYRPRKGWKEIRA